MKTRVQYKLLLQYYLKEATWANENHTPSFKEHVQVSIISSGLPMLVPVLLMGTGLATREAFEWADSAPDMVLASGEVGRFLNDMASYKVTNRSVHENPCSCSYTSKLACMHACMDR